MADDWRNAPIVDAPSWQDAPIVPEPTKSEQASRRMSHLSIPAQVGEGLISVGGNMASMSLAGLAGANAASSDAMPGDFETGRPRQINTSGADVVSGVQQMGAEAFAPESVGGQKTVETIGKGFELAVKAIKYPLSAVPFAIAGLAPGGKTGSEERQEFMEMPMSRYLGELAQDSGASPLFATLAHMAPDAVLTALGAKGYKAGTKPATPPKPKPPTVEELKAQSRALYDVVDNAGIRISSEAFDFAVWKIVDDFTSQGGRQSLTPRTHAALQELRAEAASGGVTLKKAEELRRVLGKARASLDDADRASANAAIHELDKFIENLKPRDLLQTVEGAKRTGAVGQEAIEYLKSARNLWARARKTEMMEEMIETAGINAKTYTGAGFENALRIQFKQLARKLVKDKRIKAMFTATERAAIKKVAMGTPIGNALTWLGKAAPTGVVSAGISGGAGFMIAGPAGAVLVPAVGSLSRWGATRTSLKNAKEAAEMMARGPQ